MTEEMMDQMIANHLRRQEAFKKAGLSADDAYDLADRMWSRDENCVDDMRICFECKHYKNELCTAIFDKGRPTQQLRFILQRCPQFSLKGAKHADHRD
jgi:hypothetical protein